jgi:hypothetical protein
MKNIHVLPTDKPSRLRYNLSNVLVLTKEPYRDYSKQVNQHIYITSDEEIKDVRPHKGKWQLEQEQILNKFPTYLTDLSECKLVIMTTDQELIAGGVQAIDTEFLEWFVKNPNCEYVTVCDVVFGEDRTWKKYIIIPKEEQKQHLIDIMRGDEELGLYEEPKQETLEEAAAKYVETKWEPAQEENRESFIDGAKWQAKRSYSEEEVIEFGERIAWNMVGKTITESFIRKVSKELFEQFKKKGGDK